MPGVFKQVTQKINKLQGTAGRATGKLPTSVQKLLARGLGYTEAYEGLDDHLRLLLAFRKLQNGELIGTDPVRSRRHFEAEMASIVGTPTRVSAVQDVVMDTPIGKIPARLYSTKPSAKPVPLLVFYHGGGFVVGSLDSHDEVCRLLAIHAKVQVLSIDYPLAPEVGPNVLIQSCEDALAWVYQNRRQFKILKNRIAVAGDSAGGNISAVVAQRTAAKAYAPSAQLLIYPVVDFKSRHPSFFAYKDGLTLTGQDVDRVTSLYAEQHQVALDDPIVSPTYGVLKSVAPAFVITAGHDLLHDEGEIYAIKLKQQSNKVYYQNYLDQPHGFVNFTIISRRAKKITIEMAKNFRKFWDKNAK